MSASMYERIGGTATFRRLVAHFYAGVRDDPVLRPLYPDADLAAAEERLTLFLVQYWGGPTTYSQARGHPRLRMRHAPFHVGPAARDAWLGHMLAAVEALELEPADADELWRYLATAAHSLQNQPGDPAYDPA